MLLDHLERRGLADNTIAIFMTDNGTAGGADVDQQGHVTDDGFNAGMRGVKCSPYEGGHRVPCFIRWPAGGLGGSAEHARDLDALTASIDVMPTLLDLCQVPVPHGRSFHGTSLVPALRGGPQPQLNERIVVTDSQRNARPVKWKDSAAMRDTWRLINGTALYNVAVDPEQRRDVSGQHPDLVVELRAGYERWWDLVTSRADERVPIPIQPEGPTDLNAHDWRNDAGDAPWHQGMIRDGQTSRGHWELDVVRAGRYRVELRRWPPDTAAGLADAPPAVAWRRDAVDPTDADWYEGGRVTRFDRAVLLLDDDRHEQRLDTDMSAAVFEVDLSVGPLLLQADFNGDSRGTMGAYYVRIAPVV